MKVAINCLTDYNLLEFVGIFFDEKDKKNIHIRIQGVNSFPIEIRKIEFITFPIEDKIFWDDLFNRIGFSDGDWDEIPDTFPGDEKRSPKIIGYKFTPDWNNIKI